MSKLDSLAVGQTQCHVVIEHCVHGLDPKRVYWAIEHHPESILWVPVGIVDFGGVDVSDDRTCEAIDPLLGVGVNLSVHFSQTDGLRVHNSGLRFEISLFASFMHDCIAVCEHLVTFSFSTA